MRLPSHMQVDWFFFWSNLQFPKAVSEGLALGRSYIFPSQLNVIEPWDGWVGRGLKDHPVPTPCPPGDA